MKLYLTEVEYLSEGEHQTNYFLKVRQSLKKARKFALKHLNKQQEENKDVDIICFNIFYLEKNKVPKLVEEITIDMNWGV